MTKKAKSKKRSILSKLLIGFIVFLLSSCLLTVFFTFNLDQPDLDQGRKKAEPIIAAIQLFKETEGRYPNNLQELVPEYLKRVPRASWRQPYCYRTHDEGADYFLGFVPHGDFGDGLYVYISKSEKWKQQDSPGDLSCTFLFY